MSDFIPLWLMCVIVFVAFLLCDRRVFRNVDWGLPLTFCMFFIFIGNMKRVPEFYELARSLVGGHPLEVAVGSSQVISNVPTTILLSGFCDQWRDLIIGTNLGGMGTLIASMASLISYKNVVRQYPHKKGRYLAVYSAVNVLFLAVLLTLELDHRAVVSDAQPSPTPLDGGCRRSRRGGLPRVYGWGSRSVGSWPTAGCRGCGRWWHPAWIRRLRWLCWIQR